VTSQPSRQAGRRAASAEFGIVRVGSNRQGAFDFCHGRYSFFVKKTRGAVANKQKRRRAPPMPPASNGTEALAYHHWHDDMDVAIDPHWAKDGGLLLGLGFDGDLGRLDGINRFLQRSAH
jgi:hypothetical protein